MPTCIALSPFVELPDAVPVPGGVGVTSVSAVPVALETATPSTPSTSSSTTPPSSASVVGFPPAHDSETDCLQVQSEFDIHHVLQAHHSHTSELPH